MRDGPMKNPSKAALCVAIAGCGPEREKLLDVVRINANEYWWKHRVGAPDVSR